MARGVFSYHLGLHRLTACLWGDGAAAAAGSTHAAERRTDKGSDGELGRHLLLGRRLLSSSLMDYSLVTAFCSKLARHPLRLRALVSQTRAGWWVRNGHAAFKPAALYVPAFGDVCMLPDLLLLQYCLLRRESAATSRSPSGRCAAHLPASSARRACPPAYATTRARRVRASPFPLSTSSLAPPPTSLTKFRSRRTFWPRSSCSSRALALRRARRRSGRPASLRRAAHLDWPHHGHRRRRRWRRRIGGHAADGGDGGGGGGGGGGLVGGGAAFDARAAESSTRRHRDSVALERQLIHHLALADHLSYSELTNLPRRLAELPEFEAALASVATLSRAAGHVAGQVCAQEGGVAAL